MSTSALEAVPALGWYVLNPDKTTRPARSYAELRQIDTDERYVARDQVGSRFVSTAFLGLDHSFGRGAPLLFETMCFDGDDGVDCERYSTWQEAEAGHARMVARWTQLVAVTS